jgi:carbon monoxide dehydrogenase subunit G
MSTLVQEFTVARPRAQVWSAFRDTAEVVACLPGASLEGAPGEDGAIAGALAVKLGPVSAKFGGTGRVAYDDAAFAGTLEGQGADRGTGSRAKGKAAFSLVEASAGATLVRLEVDYTLAGTLAQFARGSIVQGIAAKLTENFAQNLEARLAPPVPAEAAIPEAAPAATAPAPPAEAQLDLVSLLWRALRDWFGRLLGRGATSKP